MATLEDRVRRAEQTVQRESEQSIQHTLQTVVSISVILLSAVILVQKADGFTAHQGMASWESLAVPPPLSADSEEIGRGRESSPASGFSQLGLSTDMVG